jgi:hypothetical protein
MTAASSFDSDLCVAIDETNRSQASEKLWNALACCMVPPGVVVTPHQPSGISGQLTTRHQRNGEQSMVNRMNRLLGCSLATGLQGKNEEVNKTTHLVLSQQFSTHLAGFHQARWLIVVSD